MPERTRAIAWSNGSIHHRRNSIEVLIGRLLWVVLFFVMIWVGTN